MTKRILDRREFLRTAGTVAAGVAMTSGVTSIVATNGAWAMSLNQLTEDEANVLLRMTRHLYPHDMLGDIYYAEVVEALDGKVAADPELAGLVKNGVTELDQAMGVPWLALSPGIQLEAMRRIEAGSFFQLLRGHTVVALYNNKNVWPNFGYQGASADEGGYLFRGFQDAGWTLEPDAEASPPPFLG